MQPKDTCFKQLIRKIIDAGKQEAPQSPEALQKSAEELGFGADEVAAHLRSKQPAK